MGPEQGNYVLPVFPQNVCVECMLAAMKSGSPRSQHRRQPRIAMYFAVNPWPKGTTERLLFRLQLLREQTQVPLYSYILLDASFDQNLPTAFPWRGHVGYPLRRYTPGQVESRCAAPAQIAG